MAETTLPNNLDGQVYSLDLETFAFDERGTAQAPVCAAVVDNAAQPVVLTALEHDLPGAAHYMLDECLAGRAVLVNHQVGFDLMILAYKDPTLVPKILGALLAGRVLDTGIREKVLDNAAGMLDTEGRLYTLAALEVRVLMLPSRAAEKKDKGGDGWRTNYGALADVALADWPKEAIDYVCQDAVSPLRIVREQEARRNDLNIRLGMDPLRPLVSSVRHLASFFLQLGASRGVLVDGKRLLEIQAEVDKARDPANFPEAVKAGILVPAQPAMPMARNRAHVEGCPKKKCDCPKMMKQPVEESVSRGTLRLLAERVAKEQPELVAVRFTDASDKFPVREGFPKGGQMSVDQEFLTDHGHLHPIFREMAARGEWEKLATTDLPGLFWKGEPARRVFTGYDVVKATYRTSSMKSEGYPSVQSQNIHPAAYPALVPDPGYVLFDIDISQLELVTFAQTCLDLFGFSDLAELINGGGDAHAFLGAQIAFEVDAGFRECVMAELGGVPDKHAIYQLFRQLKGAEGAAGEFYTHFRTLAKPTGLGYPGGLGPNTMIAYAHKTYGVEISLAMATKLRDVWLQTYREAPMYFAWVRQQIDPLWSKPDDTKYRYVSPLGAIRSNARYCPMSNGKALQTPGAEAALLGLIEVWNEILGRPDSPLYFGGDFGRPPFWVDHFIHDAIWGQTLEAGAHERVQRARELMEGGMRTICPSMKCSTEAVLMRRGQKKCKPTFDAEGRLVPTENF